MIGLTTVTAVLAVAVVVGSREEGGVVAGVLGRG
jgi:hypothetical protein